MIQWTGTGVVGMNRHCSCCWSQAAGGGTPAAAVTAVAAEVSWPAAATASFNWQLLLFSCCFSLLMCQKPFTPTLIHCWLGKTQFSTMQENFLLLFASLPPLSETESVANCPLPPPLFLSMQLRLKIRWVVVMMGILSTLNVSFVPTLSNKSCRQSVTSKPTATKNYFEYMSGVICQVHITKGREFGWVSQIPTFEF